MHSLTMDCDTFWNEEIFTVVVLVTSAEVKVTNSKARLALCFSTLLSRCMIKGFRRLALN